MEQNEALDPVYVCLFCLVGIAFVAQILPDLVQESQRVLRNAVPDVIHDRINLENCTYIQ